MSVDYFLYSPKHDKSVMVGSDGMSGPMPWPGDKEVVEFVRWVIEEFVDDVILIDEHRLGVLREDKESAEG